MVVVFVHMCVWYLCIVITPKRQRAEKRIRRSVECVEFALTCI